MLVRVQVQAQVRCRGRACGRGCVREARRRQIERGWGWLQCVGGGLQGGRVVEVLSWVGEERLGDAGGPGVRRGSGMPSGFETRGPLVVRLGGGYEERAEAVLARLARPGRAGQHQPGPHTVERVQCGWRSLSKRG